MKEVIVNSYPKSSVTEAIHAIKTNLRFSSINKKIKTILVTSSIAGEGKSFISANLATTFATSTEKVLLIDCDLRKGRQNKVFELEEEQKLGLSNLLIDENWEKNIDNYISKTKVENLDLLTTGAIPPNPTTLLESEKLDQILAQISSKYDIIILDTPPLMGLSDALILTRLVDTVLVVVRARKTTMEILENTISSLKNVNANIAGVILNRIKNNKNKYYKDY